MGGLTFEGTRGICHACYFQHCREVNLCYFFATTKRSAVLRTRIFRDKHSSISSSVRHGPRPPPARFDSSADHTDLVPLEPQSSFLGVHVIARMPTCARLQHTYLLLVLVDHGKMADIPGHHLGHAVLHGVALRGHHQVSAHGSDLLHGGALARLPQQSHLGRAGQIAARAERGHNQGRFWVWMLWSCVLSRPPPLRSNLVAGDGTAPSLVVRERKASARCCSFLC